jgi:GYF domain 2
MELSLDYFVRFSTGAESGPYTADELRELARSSRLKPTDFIRRGEFGTWVVAARTRGFEFSDTKKPVAPIDDSPLEAVEPIDAAAGSATAAAAEPPRAPIPSAVAEATTESGYIVTLALRGFNMRTLPGEVVCYTLAQDFVDAFRVSMFAALLGKRGTLVVTSRRVIIANVTLTTRHVDVLYLDALDRVSVATRVSVARCVLGGVFALGGVLTLLLAMSGILGSVGLMMPFGSMIATAYGAFLLALGALMLILSRARVLELRVASGSVRFAKRHVDFDALHRIDEVRAAAHS